MTASTSRIQQRKTMRRPLRAMAAAVVMALPSAGLTTSLRRNTVRMSLLDQGKKISGSLKDFEFAPSRTRTRGRSSMTPPPSPLEMICDEGHEFELNLGKAVDTLKQDYPDMLTDPPEFSIYHPNLEVVDPSGVKLHGLKNYKNAFRLVHTVVNLFYCPERSLLTFRLVYDWARNEIRVSWNAEVVPKAIFGGTKTTLHVDGISVYVLDRESGKIVQHRVEHLMINDDRIAPKRGIIHALQKQVIEPDGVGVPSFAGNHVVEFRPNNNLFTSPSSSLFYMSSSMHSSDDVDSEALERKNASRKKFGLKPLTPEEFKEIQAQVEQMEVQQRQRAASASSATEYPEEKEQSGFLNKLFGNVLEDTCESNFDCQRPQVCCDFGFVKRCCSSGQMVNDGPRYGDKATVPVTAGYPPGFGPESDPRTF